MSDERGWYRSGEGEPEAGEDRSEAYRAWQRQQQLQRPWDRQQPWQQESVPEPPYADEWSRSGSHQQHPDDGAAGPDLVPNEDDFRPPYRPQQQNPGPPVPNPPVPNPPVPNPPGPQPPRPARPQPVPPPFQPQYAPPRPDAPPLPVRGRHGGAQDSQELPRLPRPDQELPRLPRADFAGLAGAGPGAGPPEPGRRGGGPPTGEFNRPPTGEFSRPPTGEFKRPQMGEFNGPPTGGNLPRISDPARRGPDMYSNEPPRPGSPRHDGSTATEQLRPDRGGAGPSRAGAPRPDSSRTEPGPSRAEAGRAGRGVDGRGVDGRGTDGRGPDGRGTDNRGTDGRGSRGIGGGDDTGPRSRGGAYGVPGAGHGRSKPSSGNGGNRGLLIVGTTVGVIALALIAYFATRPSGNSGAGATADATSSSTQGAVIPPAPSTGAASGKPTATGSAGTGPANSSSASTSPTSSSTVAVNKGQVHVQVFNGSGVNQRAAGIKSALVNDGFVLATVAGTDPKTPTTKVYYPAARADSAAAIANALAIPSADLAESQMYPEVTVVIGTDWSTGNTYPAQ